MITTWRSFLLYGLDLITKDECAASTFFIACNQIKYDATTYSTTNSQVIVSKILWPTTELEDFLINPELYRKYLDNIASSPSANIGKLMMCSYCMPCYLFVPDIGSGTHHISQTSRLVHILQQQLFDAYGIGSIWFDGLLYQRDGNEYAQDSKRLLESMRLHFKQARRNVAATQQASGILYRDTRMNHLTSMSESQQRQYLNKHYKVDTDGMDAQTVFAMMVDLFVDEAEGPSGDMMKETLRKQYKESMHKKKL